MVRVPAYHSGLGVSILHVHTRTKRKRVAVLVIVVVVTIVCCCWLLLVGNVLTRRGLIRWDTLDCINTICQGDAAMTVDRPAFYNTDTVDWCQNLRAAYRTVRTEYDTAHVQAPTFGALMPEQAVLSEWGLGGKWRVVVLRFYSRDTEVPGFPVTRRLIESIPHCTTAMFSILEPGRELVTHRGPNLGVLRYHLALRVPTDYKCCRLRVADCERHWREGEDLMFDDTYPHSAINSSSETRVVLFLDVLRPLRSPWRFRLNGWFHRVLAPRTLPVRNAVVRANKETK